MSSKEFHTEADIRNFKNKVLLLPKKLQLKINEMIESGHRQWAIEGMLKREYKGSLGTPTPPTLRNYIDWYNAKKQLHAAAGTPDTLTRTELAIIEKEEADSILDEHKSILDTSTPVENKKILLETLIRKCIERIHKVENLQELEGMTASLEAVLGSYLREIHSLTTTQLKLSGELQEENNAVIAKLVESNLYSLVNIFFKVLQKVCPDQIELIKGELHSALVESKELANLVQGSPDVIQPPSST